MNVLVFTDLDGTLLDPDSYSFDGAQTALDVLGRQQIPLIFTTSKTRSEIERLQAAMQIREPFIAENGAAVYFPDGYRNFKISAGFRYPPYTIIQIGMTYSEIRRFIYSLKERYAIKGFGDLSVGEIEALTGLSPEESSLAKLREFTEPFLIEDEKKISEIAALAASRGIKITSGGRFFHFIGMLQDKGRAVRQCGQVFAENIHDEMVTIGLGDSANDISLLKNVDIPILLPHPDGSYEDVHLFNLKKASSPGSRGWNDAMLDTLSHLEQWRIPQ
jgi:mannosyl-3-phosphoglycerate phosphatase